MSLLFTSFGTVFGLIALLIMGSSGFSAESFAMAVIVVVVGMLLSLFVMDSLRPSERSTSRRAWIRKVRKHFARHRRRWWGGLAGVAALGLILYLSTRSTPAVTEAPAWALATPAPTVASPATPVPAPLPAKATLIPPEAPPHMDTAAPQAPPAPAPVPAAPVPSPASSTVNTTDVLATIDGWRLAWEHQDTDNYLAAYAPDFRPSGGLSLSAWRAQRKDRVGRARDIHIQLDQMKVTVEGNQASARFVQRYSAAQNRDTMRKQLLLVRTPAGWRIVEEKPDTSTVS